MGESALADAARFIVERRKKRMALAVRAVQETVLTRGPQLIQQEIDATTPLPVDRGTYRRGWKFVRVKEGAEVYATTPYAAIVEDGRRPGKMPPIEPLVGWVKRKGLVTGRGKKAQADARGAAFAIARAIAKRGIRGRKVFARASKKLRAEVRQAIKKAMATPIE